MILPKLPNYVKRYCCTSQPLHTDGRFLAILENYKQKNTTQTQNGGKRQQKQIKQKGTWISKELIHERTHSFLLPASPCPHTQEHDHETDNHMQTTEQNPTLN